MLDTFGGRRRSAAGRRPSFNLAAAKRRVEVLPRQLDGELDEFDHVLIDCPPNYGLLAVNAVVLASELLVPVRVTNPNSTDGLGDLLSFLEEMARGGLGAAGRRSGVDSDERHWWDCGLGRVPQA
ncbi:MAG TPA: AAA family ATPase [Solirubrobacteraceae bacterium]|nr:AAA family ATPase [Solirubrobacteraceae bacterium]